MKAVNLCAISLACAGLFAIPGYSEARSCVIDQPVQAYLRLNKGWRLVDLANLNADDRALWLSAGRGICPGVAKGYIAADGGPYYALALFKDDKFGRLETLVSLREVHGKLSAVRLVDPEVVRNLKVVWRARPGWTRDVKENRRLRIARDSFVYELIESEAHQFYLSGGKFRSIATAQ